jgi:hypothetical protein
MCVGWVAELLAGSVFSTAPQPPLQGLRTASQPTPNSTAYFFIDSSPKTTMPLLHNAEEAFLYGHSYNRKAT